MTIEIPVQVMHYSVYTETEPVKQLINVFVTVLIRTVNVMFLCPNITNLHKIAIRY